MKPEWITPEVVRLARRLNDAGYQKDIKEGDWYMVKGHWRPALSTGEMGGATVKQQGGGLIPIPTLTEILDWLAEHTKETAVDMPTLHCDKISAGDVWICWIDKGEYYVGDTPTEAAMLAMLKILEVENE